MQSRRGAVLIDVVVAGAIFALLLGAVLAPLTLGLHRLLPDPQRIAVQDLVREQLLIAADLLKYNGASLTPTSTATSVPLANASVLPVTLSLSAIANGNGSQTITITAAYRADSSTESLSQSATLAAQAPLPGATILEPGLVAAPTGAP